MPIDWSNNDNNVRLLAATYAVLGKETFSRERCYREIAQRFGNGASYDAIQKRFKTIAAKSETLQEQGTGTALPIHTQASRPDMSRKRPRDSMPTLDADDFEVIEQGRFRTPIRPPRNLNIRQAQPTEPTTCPSSVSEIEIIEHNAEAKKETHASSANLRFSTTTSATPSSIETVSRPLKATVVDDGSRFIEERLAQTSQEHAKERARYRLSYMDAPPAKKARSILNLHPISRPAVSAQASAWSYDAASVVAPVSYIDSINRGCVLCKKRWSSLQQARQHELESEQHRSNMCTPVLVREANLKLTKMRSVSASGWCGSELVASKATETTEMRSQPMLDRSAASLPTSNTPASSRESRESSVIIVDCHPRPDKGKGRAAPSATPAPVLIDVGRDLRRWSVRHIKDLPEEIYDLFQEMAANMMGPAAGREQLSSYCVSSTRDDSDDEDYVP